METIRTEVKIVTPEYALELLKINTRNRTMSKPTVLFYVEQMKRGVWKFNGEPIIIGEGNVLLDGQHRLAAIVKSGLAQKCIITYGIDPSTFDTIDTGKIRSSGDMFSISGIINAKAISSIISSYFVFKTKTVTLDNYSHNIKLSKTEILNKYYELPEFWQEIFKQAARYNDKLKLLKISFIGGLMSFLILEKKHDKQKVMSFFNQLFYDTNIENEVIPLLRDKLLKDLIGQYKMTNKLRMAFVVKAWNYYIQGKEVKMLTFNVDKEILPEFI